MSTMISITVMNDNRSPLCPRTSVGVEGAMKSPSPTEQDYTCHHHLYQKVWQPVQHQPKILASPKLQGPPPKVSSIAQPAEIPLTLGEQVRAKGLAVLTAIDPETENLYTFFSSSSVQAAIAQGAA